MALQTKVGSFAKPAGAGAQAITGLGFQPKAIIFWWNGADTPNTWKSHIFLGIGITAGPTNSYCCTVDDRDGASPTSSQQRVSTKVISQMDWNGGVHEADLTSFDANGFTLAWGANNSGVSVEVMYLALGGSDLTNAKAITWGTPTAIGPKAVTGVGFSPDLVMHAGGNGLNALGTMATAAFGMGWMNKHGQQAGNALQSVNNRNPSLTNRLQQTDACLLYVDEDEVIREQGHFTSMDADGFTLYFSNVITAAAFQRISLCLKGVSSKIGSFAKRAAAAPVTQVVDKVGFTPKALLASGISNYGMAAPMTQLYYTFGGSDGTTNRAMGMYDVEGVSITQVKSIYVTDGYVLPRLSSGPAVLAKGVIASMDADGFTTTWNPATTDQTEEVIYLAIGDAGVNTFPSRVAGS